MRKKLIISILMIGILISQMILPVIANAFEIENNEMVGTETTLSVVVRRTSNTIKITAKDPTYKITDLKYVHKDIKLADISYFEESNDEIYTFNIMPANEISESFEMNGYGTYTIYTKNEKGDRMLNHITIKDPAESPEITLTRDENNLFNLNIQISSKNNIIKVIKIAKKEKYDDKIDFKTTGSELEFTESGDVNIKYTSATEEGIYVIFAEDSEGNTSTQQIYLGETKTPIKTNLNIDNSKREIQLQAIDTVCNVSKIKIAKKSEINSINDFSNKGKELTIAPSKEINLTYKVTEDGDYLIYVEDEAGYKKMTQFRVSAENSIEISLSQNKENKKELTITAKDTLADIVKIKVAIGNDIDIDYFKTNGEEINIEQGKEVTVKYNIEKNCILNIYVEDENGYRAMTTRNIDGIDGEKPDPTPEPDTKAPEITGVENNKIYKTSVTPVIVDENLDTIILKKNNKTVEKYQNKTEISEEGIYELIAIDKAKNETKIAFTIDKTAPEIKISAEQPDNKNIKLTITAIDNLTKIVKVKFAKGEQTEEYFAEKGQELETENNDKEASGRVNITANGIYTIYVEDEAGNIHVEAIQVTSIVDNKDNNKDDNKDDNKDNNKDDNKDDNKDNSKDDNKDDNKDNTKNDNKVDDKNNNQNTNKNNSTNNISNTNNKNNSTKNQTTSTINDSSNNNGETKTTTSESNLPKTGRNGFLIIVGIITTGACTIINYIRYKRIK